MDVNGTGALVVAVVAVIGTLSSAQLTERAAERSRIREQERIEQARAWAEEAGVRRACCVALNAASRQYLAALTDQLYALLRSEDPSAARQRLTEARDVHRGVYAEAQLLLPDPVLAQAGEVTHALGTCYGRLRRLDDGVPRPGDSLDAARGEVDAMWDQLRELRRGMRADLAGPGTPARPGPAALRAPRRPYRRGAEDRRSGVAVPDASPSWSPVGPLGRVAHGTRGVPVSGAEGESAGARAVRARAEEAIGRARGHAGGGDPGGGGEESG